MITILLKFLPQQYRDLIALGQRITRYADVSDLEELGTILADGKVTAREWAKLGKSLGIVGK